MHCYVILSNIFQLRRIKMIPIFTADKCWRVIRYVCLCFIVMSIIVGTVGYVRLLCGNQVFVYFVSFLSMIIYKVLYIHDV